MKKIHIKNNFEKTIKKTVRVLKEGGLVVFPSDTVYGLAVDAENQEAVNKLLAFKNRWTGKAISVAVLDIKMAKRYVNLNNKAKRIYENLLPGPFTVISRGKHKVAKGVEAEDGSLGIRITESKLMSEVTKKLGGAITATSANLAGRSPHYSVESFLKTLSEKKKNMIDLIIDGEKLAKSKPSTVINTIGKKGVLRRGELLIGNRGKSLLSKSEKETRKIAEFLVKKILNLVQDDKAIVFGLTGDLGCGKTVFARGVAEALGMKERVQSPTFVIYNEYKMKNNAKFLHFDLYRIEKKFEMKEIGFLKLFEKGTIACVEWPERMGKKNFEKLRKKIKYVGVQFSYVDEETREIEI